MNDKSKIYFGNIFSDWLAPILGLLFLGSAVCYLQQTKLKTIGEAKVQDYQQQEQITKSQLKLLQQIPAFGFDNLIANWAYLNFTQYFGDAPARKATGNTLSSDYFSAVVKHDPRFVDAYLRLAPATTLYSGRPKITVALLDRVLESLSPDIPDSYLIWVYKGVDELLFLGDTQAARKSYGMAAEWAKVRDTEDSRIVGNRAKETADFLATNPDSKKAQASSWMMIYSNAREEQIRNMALQQIKSLGGEVIFSENKMTVKMPEDNQS